MARFHFADLCRAPLGSADFGAIAREFHTVLVEEIPVMNINENDVARRFITLIDELYQHKVKLICSAQDKPEKLFPLTLEAGDGNRLGEEEVFAFARTVSRLNEMQTSAYVTSKKPE